jgi:hypothetical protein
MYTYIHSSCILIITAWKPISIRTLLPSESVRYHGDIQRQRPYIHVYLLLPWLEAGLHTRRDGAQEDQPEAEHDHVGLQLHSIQGHILLVHHFIQGQPVSYHITTHLLLR